MSDGYLMAGQLSELERLQLQSRVWEPAGAAVLRELPPETGSRALDVGCGAMGLLRSLSAWVGPDGAVVGTDIADALLDTARIFVADEGLTNVSLEHDDLFDSRLDAHSFDLVHARFQLAPLGRIDEQLTACTRWLRPGGWLFLEEPDSASWHFNPPAPAAEQLIQLILTSFSNAGGDFDAGRSLPGWLRSSGDPQMNSTVLALPPGHPYLRLPLQFAASLEPRLLELISATELRGLLEQAEMELASPGRWGTTFTLIQAWIRLR